MRLKEFGTRIQKCYLNRAYGKQRLPPGTPVQQRYSGVGPCRSRHSILGVVAEETGPYVWVTIYGPAHVRSIK